MSKAKEIIGMFEQEQQLPLFRSDPEKMKQIAKEAKLFWEPAMENVMEYGERIYVDVSKMTEEEYDEMIKEVEEFEYEGDGFSIITVSDASGYDYWKDQSEYEDYQYIMILVKIFDPYAVDTRKLKSQVEDVFIEFEKYDNVRGERY